ncbi:hypothetical protein M9H77_04935 [Catharanthus roseus]|uniref:Uncharacterized protein n=1 Tax=Catharanthus roseus TaxID=4058 RepID=A0ACC0CFH2_CATRO|nr:hypothetical protein M9H77_04935 [Catharanthus roseus]
MSYTILKTSRSVLQPSSRSLVHLKSLKVPKWSSSKTGIEIPVYLHFDHSSSFNSNRSQNPLCGSGELLIADLKAASAREEAKIYAIDLQNGIVTSNRDDHDNSLAEVGYPSSAKLLVSSITMKLVAHSIELINATMLSLDIVGKRQKYAIDVQNAIVTSYTNDDKNSLVEVKYASSATSIILLVSSMTVKNASFSKELIGATKLP